MTEKCITSTLFDIIMFEWPIEAKRRGLQEPSFAASISEAPPPEKEIIISTKHGRYAIKARELSKSTQTPIEQKRAYNLEKFKFVWRRALEEGLGADDWYFINKNAEALGLKSEIETYYRNVPKCLDNQCSLFCEFYRKGCINANF